MPPPSKPWYVPAFGHAGHLHEGALHVNHIPLYLDPARAARRHAHRPCGARQRAGRCFPAGGGGVPWPAGLCVALIRYPSKALDGKQVPTWNYAAVHAHGTLSAFDDPEGACAPCWRR